MAQRHCFKSEWPSEALSGARRSHSGRFGVVRQAVAERPLFAHSCRRLTAGRGVDSTSSPDASPRRRVPRRPLVAPGCRPASDHRSHVRDRLRAAILQRSPKGDCDRRSREPAKGDRATLADADMA
jgi:hypothetical protein